MTNASLKRLLLVAVALLFVPAAATAQPQPTVVKRNDLSFGTVVAGLSTQIQPTDTRAGKFEILGNPRMRVSLTFTLPQQLGNPGTGIPIAWGPTSAVWNDIDQPSGGTPFDPQQGADIRLSTDRNAYVWLGGTLMPGTNQAAGFYTAVVTISVARN